jgi:hypothetical protein
MATTQTKENTCCISDTALKYRDLPRGRDYLGRLAVAGLLDRSSNEPDRLVIAVKQKG